VAALIKSPDQTGEHWERERDLEHQVGVWTERLQKMSGRLEVLEADLAGARGAIQILRQHHEDQLADLEAESSDLARELTAVIADRGQLKKYSAMELQLAVLRRLWPFR